MSFRFQTTFLLFRFDFFIKSAIFAVIIIIFIYLLQEIES